MMLTSVMNNDNVSKHARDCGTCTMCCKVLGIPELKKPRGDWCEHCDIGKGCKIYDQRPKVCRGFNCVYILDPDFPEEWKPNNSRMVVVRENSAITVHVDPNMPSIWRDAPYFMNFKRWATDLENEKGSVFIYIGARVIVILPDKEIDLGVIADDETILMSQKVSSSGIVRDAIKIKKNDPRAKIIEEA
jgi:hypothetical protein